MWQTTNVTRVVTAMMLAVGMYLGMMTSAHAAGIIAFQDLPTGLATPPNISFHNATGPVIADDFAPIAGGPVGEITWWGSAADSTSWELVFQNNNPALGEPALTPPGNIFSGGVKAFVTATGAPYAPLPGVFQFSADFSNTFNLNPGTEYWLTVANTAPGWAWAQALNGATIGSEQFNAHSSTGGICQDGGPHCGPWTDIHTDFAFSVSAVPEPSSFIFLATGVIGFIVWGRRQHLKVL